MKAVRLACFATLFLAASAAFAGGRVVAGRDLTRLLPPSGAVVEPYRNLGYEVRFVDGAVEIEVDLSPLQRRVPFELPKRDGGSRLERVAREVVTGSSDLYDAASRILSWVAVNIRYDLDRGRSQEPAQVMARRSAYCTGTAKLTVALLAAVGIEAREVPGYLVEDHPAGPRAGFHRWVEVHFPGHGWVFSDPHASFHFVPATYVRLAEERLADAPGVGRLLERRNEIDEIDLAPAAPSRVRARPNDATRHSAALVVRLEATGSGDALLVGEGVQRAVRIADGRGSFLGLAPGRYELRVTSEGRLAAHKALVFRAPVLAELLIPRIGTRLLSGGSP